MKVTSRIALLLLTGSCAAPYADSLSPPRAEACDSLRRGLRRATACALLVGTVVDSNGNPVPKATVAYAPKDRTRDTEGRIYETETDAAGRFRVTLYRFAGRATNPDTVTIQLFGTTASPRLAAQGLIPRTPRWQGVTEATVTYVRVGSALALAVTRIVVDNYVPR